MRRVAIAITAAAFALVGPRLNAPQNRAAGEAFVYEPPEGFVRVMDAPSVNADEETEWVHPATAGRMIAPRIHVKRSKTLTTVEPADLAKIAAGMPAVLEESGITWTDVRQETRTRADGARVGLIEGECTKKSDDLAPGAGAVIAPRPDSGVKVRYRRLLFLFPTDEGSAFATAIYGKDEMARWQPELEATIAKTKGVAVRVMPSPPWMYAAWGGAGLVMAWLVASLMQKRDGSSDAKADEATNADEAKDADA